MNRFVSAVVPNGRGGHQLVGRPIAEEQQVLSQFETIHFLKRKQQTTMMLSSKRSAGGTSSVKKKKRKEWKKCEENWIHIFCISKV